MLIDHIKHFYSDDAPLSHMQRSQQMSYYIRKGLSMLQLGMDFTSHSMRAGWATSRFLSLQPIPELMSDGNWSSESSLKIYLDVIASSDAMQHPRVIELLPYLQGLQNNFCNVWSVGPAAHLHPRAPPRHTL